MPNLKGVVKKPLDRPGAAPQDQGAFPFHLPAIRTLPALDLDVPVTFFAGENGSGKSTLLEAIAFAAELPSLGADQFAVDPSLSAQRALGSALRLSWSRRSRRGLFLRAEDFFGYLKRQARDDARIARERDEEVDADPAESLDHGHGARHIDEVNAARYLSRYDARSHGESFMDVFTTRLRPDGLYLLDEPEAPLSPTRQLALLSVMKDAERAGSQFIIATHSPILLAYPGARIYSFDRTPIAEVAYDDLENVTVTRSFLSDPSRYLRHLAIKR